MQDRASIGHILAYVKRSLYRSVTRHTQTRPRATRAALSLASSGQAR
jgi:hypothetical protein